MNIGGNTDDERIEKMVSYLMARSQSFNQKPIQHRQIKINKFIKVTDDNEFAKTLYEYDKNILIWGKENSNSIDIFLDTNNDNISNIYITRNTINLVQLCNKDRLHFGLSEIKYNDINNIFKDIVSNFSTYEWVMSVNSQHNTKITAKYNKEILINDIINIYKFLKNYGK